MVWHSQWELWIGTKKRRDTFYSMQKLILWHWSRQFLRTRTILESHPKEMVNKDKLTVQWPETDRTKMKVWHLVRAERPNAVYYLMTLGYSQQYKETSLFQPPTQQFLVWRPVFKKLLLSFAEAPCTYWVGKRAHRQAPVLLAQRKLCYFSQAGMCLMYPQASVHEREKSHSSC